MPKKFYTEEEKQVLHFTNVYPKKGSKNWQMSYRQWDDSKEKFTTKNMVINFPCTLNEDILKNKLKLYRNHEYQRACKYGRKVLEEMQVQLHQERSETTSIFDFSEHWFHLLNLGKIRGKKGLYLSKRTINSYKSTYQNYIKPWIVNHLLARDIKTITSNNIQDYIYAKESLSGNTINLHLTVWKSIFKLAKTEHYITNNPVLGDNIIAPPKKAEREIQFLNTKQINSLLKILKKDKSNLTFYTLIVLMVTHGLRPNEALGLRYRDIDFKTNTIAICHFAKFDDHSNTIDYENVGKTDASSRTIIVNEKLINLLKKVKEEHDYFFSCMQQKEYLHNFGYNPLHYYAFNAPKDIVFRQKYGKPYTTAYARNHFKTVLKKYNFSPKISLYELRHSAASFLYEQGLTEFEISKILGHTNPGITKRVYIQLNKQRQRELIKNATDKLDI